MKFKEKAVDKWKSNHTWQPFLIAIAIILIIAISHKTYWEITTETNPSNIWDERNTINDENLTIIQYGNGELVNQTVTFKGVLEIFPYTNISIGPLEKANGTFDPAKAERVLAALALGVHRLLSLHQPILWLGSLRLRLPCKGESAQ